MHCGARQRARSRDMSVYKIVGSMHSSVYIPRIVFGINPQLSHSDVHLMTHDVQLPAMMCNCTNCTYKIKALPKGLWWGAVVTEAARRSRSGLEARTLLARHGTDAYSPA